MVTMGVSSYNDVEFRHSSISENRIYHVGVRFVATIDQHVVAIAFHKSCISLAYINIVNRKGGVGGEHSSVIDIFRWRFCSGWGSSGRLC